MQEKLDERLGPGGAGEGVLLFTGRWVYNWGAYRVGRGGVA